VGGGAYQQRGSRSWRYRRVATLVARAAPPAQMLGAVTEEAGRLLRAGHAAMGRYGPDDTITAVAAWDSAGAAFPVGTRWSLGGQDLHTMVLQTARPARIDDYAGASSPVAEVTRELGLRAEVGVPVSVEGRLWGVMVVDSRAEPLPAGTEERMAGFTEPPARREARGRASRVPLRMPQRRTRIPTLPAGTCSRARPARCPVPRCSPENDLADHGSVEIDHEKAGRPLGRPRDLALKLV
jgi:GAF domain